MINRAEGSKWYSKDDPLLLERFEREADECQKQVEANLATDLQFVRVSLSAEYRVACYYLGILSKPDIAQPSPQSKMLFSAFHKNLFVFYSSLLLTTRGFYGPARSLLRHVYESLIVAKFCALASDPSVYSHWEQGETVYFTNSVLKKIAAPDKTVFDEFWKLMCQFSHPTIYAQQISIGWETDKDDIRLNFVLLRALIECHYHLLNSYLITPSMRHVVERYSDDEELRRLKALIRALFRESRASLLPQPRRLISSYKRTWKLI
ncbi:MAG: hypothetical protein Q7T26_09360 [Dehalococcoidia bacterium]|nr:hypothetical protein [Dehalococcoidia bacterium]